MRHDLAHRVVDVAGAVVGWATHRAANGPRPLRTVLVQLLESIKETRIISMNGGEFTLRTSSSAELYRAETFWTKEPETLDWLTSTFGPRSVLYDVGANIGLYTLFALRVGGEGSRAVCFEPSAFNFGPLCRNLSDNDMDRRAVALAVALGEQSGLETFALSSIMPGAALHGDSYVQLASAPFWQGVVVLPLDEVVEFGLPSPTHLKIDVDGPELAVLAGARRTLASETLRHVLIEVTEQQQPDVNRELEDAGFVLTAVGEPVQGIRNQIYSKTG